MHVSKKLARCCVSIDVYFSNHGAHFTCKINQSNLQSLLNPLSMRFIQLVCVHPQLVLHFQFLCVFGSLAITSNSPNSCIRRSLHLFLYITVKHFYISMDLTILMGKVLLLLVECENMFFIFALLKQCLYFLVMDSISD